MKVAIIGSEGVLGKANQKLFSSHELVPYDISQMVTYPRKEIESCDFAVICVGTPPAPDRTADLSYLTLALDQMPTNVPLLVRSTVPPGTTDSIARRWPSPVGYCPEFLYERPGGAWAESTDVPYTILGGRQDALNYFGKLLYQTYGNMVYVCDSLSAELIKYTVNLYWATKVTFVNQMARITEHLGGDWETVQGGWLRDPRVNEHYTAMEGFPPGYGGRCWPKDIAALIEHARSKGLEPWFLQAVEDSNQLFGGEVVHGGQDGAAGSGT